MTVERATYLSNLNPSQPQNGDLIKEGDDHLRLIKASLLNTLPGLDSAVEVTSSEFNALKTNLTMADSGLTFKKSVTFTEGQGIALNSGKITGLVNATSPADAMPKAQIDAVLEEQTDAVNELIDQVNQQLATIASLVYPVGTVYATKDPNLDPSKAFGVGVWVRISGRVLVGAGTLNDGTYTRSFSVGAVGGSFEHKLTNPEMPLHSHTASKVFISSPQGAGYDSGPGHTPSTITTTSSGGDQPHNNMQPYVAVNFWERVS